MAEKLYLRHVITAAFKKGLTTYSLKVLNVVLES